MAEKELQALGDPAALQEIWDECGYWFFQDVLDRRRRILGEEGFLSVIVVVDSVTGKVVSGPEIHARGFVEDDAVFDEVKPAIIEVLRTIPDFSRAYDGTRAHPRRGQSPLARNPREARRAL